MDLVAPAQELDVTVSTSDVDQMVVDVADRKANTSESSSKNQPSEAGKIDGAAQKQASQPAASSTSLETLQKLFQSKDFIMDINIMDSLKQFIAAGGKPQVRRLHMFGFINAY